MPDTWRLFIAIELPTEIVTYLAKVQEWLKSRTPRGAVRWVEPENVHLTIKFLGDVSVAYQKSLQDELSKATTKHAPFSLAAGGMGCFPSPRRPRVAWVGVQQDSDTLQALRNSVETYIAPLGYPTENRPYHPHLTLGRVRRDANRNDAQRLGELLQEHKFTERHSWTVEHVTLFRSELTPNGAVYTPLFHAPLHPDK